MEPIADALPRPNARIVGAVYLIYFLTAVLAVFLVRGLVVPGEAAATATRILAHEPLYRSGSVVGLIANVLYIGLTALFYRLFEPVNRSMSLLAAFFGLVGCAIQIFGGLFQLAPLIVLGDSPFLRPFTLEQLQGMALLFLKLNVQTIEIALVFFALYDLLIGWLIYKSTFLPRALGVLMMLAGLGWLTFAWPPLAASLSWCVQPLGFLAEFVLMMWLIIKGVNVSRWRQSAAEAGGRLGPVESSSSRETA